MPDAQPPTTTPVVAETVRCEIHQMVEPCENCRRYLPLLVGGQLRVFDLARPADVLELRSLHRQVCPMGRTPHTEEWEGHTMYACGCPMHEIDGTKS